MRNLALIAAAALASSACGGATDSRNEGADEGAAAAPLPADPNVIEPDRVQTGGAGNGAAPVPSATPAAASPRQPQSVAPGPKQAPARPEQRRPPAPKATAPAKAPARADPHEGHDMANMSHD